MRASTATAAILKALRNMDLIGTYLAPWGFDGAVTRGDDGDGV